MDLANSEKICFWWRILDACAESGCLCGFCSWQHYVWIYFEVIWYPRWTHHQASPALYQRSGCMKSHTWKLPEGRGWNEMKWYMSCYVITLACRVMSWHVGVGGFWLGHLAISDNGNLQVRFHDDIDGSSLARAIYASTGILPSIAVSPLTLVGSSSCTRRHAVPSKDPMIFRSSVGFQEFLFRILAHSRQSTHPLWQRGNGRMTKIGC